MGERLKWPLLKQKNGIKYIDVILLLLIKRDKTILSMFANFIIYYMVE